MHYDTQRSPFIFSIANVHVHFSTDNKVLSHACPVCPKFLYHTAGKRSKVFTNHLSSSSIHDHISSSSTTGGERSQHTLMLGVTILTGDLNVFTTRVEIIFLARFILVLQYQLPPIFLTQYK